MASGSSKCPGPAGGGTQARDAGDGQAPRLVFRVRLRGIFVGHLPTPLRDPRPGGPERQLASSAWPPRGWWG
jgi:hypothetical protein